MSWCIAWLLSCAKICLTHSASFKGPISWHWHLLLMQTKIPWPTIKTDLILDWSTNPCNYSNFQFIDKPSPGAQSSTNQSQTQNGDLCLSTRPVMVEWLSIYNEGTYKHIHISRLVLIEATALQLFSGERNKQINNLNLRVLQIYLSFSAFCKKSGKQKPICLNFKIVLNYHSIKSRQGLILFMLLVPKTVYYLVQWDRVNPNLYAPPDPTSAAILCKLPG